MFQSDISVWTLFSFSRASGIPSDRRSDWSFLLVFGFWGQKLGVGSFCFVCVFGGMGSLCEARANENACTAVLCRHLCRTDEACHGFGLSPCVTLGEMLRRVLTPICPSGRSRSTAIHRSRSGVPHQMFLEGHSLKEGVQICGQINLQSPIILVHCSQRVY